MIHKSYRHCASFGKRIEYYLIGKMLKGGLDVYIPMVDDDAVDVVIKRSDGKYVEVQIKARSKEVAKGNAALFAAISHEHRENYWFVFYSERLDSMWIMSSSEFIKESHQNKTGKNAGKYSIRFNNANNDEELVSKLNRYKADSFCRIAMEDPK